MAAKTKVTLYIPEPLHEEMKAEAERQDRTVSWIVEHCWKLSRSRVRSYPSISELYGDEDLDANA